MAPVFRVLGLHLLWQRIRDDQRLIIPVVLIGRLGPLAPMNHVTPDYIEPYNAFLIKLDYWKQNIIKQD